MIRNRVLSIVPIVFAKGLVAKVANRYLSQSLLESSADKYSSS